MSYGLIYTIPFATQDNVACVVEIEKDGYAGASTELLAGAVPFNVEIDDTEFLYTPTRFSTAQIQVVGNDYLRTLFSTDYRQFRVTFKRAGVVTWCGYVKPEVYTQDYSSDTFTLEIECISAMSVLEYVDYAQTEVGTKQFVTMWSLLRKCMVECRGRYGTVYIPHVYARDAASYAAGTNVFEQMTISEQDFFDEEGKPMTLRAVLEEICKFFGWTCVDWLGDLYFVDVDHVGEYFQYDALLTAKTGVATPLSAEVQNVGFAGADHTLDILPGYNKVRVKCSNYPVGERSFSLNLDGYEPLRPADDTQIENRVSRRILYKPTEGMIAYKFVKPGIIDEFDKVTDLDEFKSDYNAVYGALPERYCNYEIKDGKPSITDYTYTDAIRVRIRPRKSSSFTEELPQLSLRPVYYVDLPCAAYSDGCIAISAALKITSDSELSAVDNGFDPVAKVVADFLLEIGEEHYTNRIQKSVIVEEWKKGKIDYSSTIPTGSEFKVVMEWDWNENGVYSMPNKKTLNDPYPGATGFIIPIPHLMTGRLRFGIVGGFQVTHQSTAGHLWHDIRIGFFKKGDSPEKDSNNDRIYENVLNESYINELDDIELKISSYNDDGACYSKVLFPDGYLTDNLYNSILGKNKRPEEMLINRIINHYSDTRLKLTQEIRADKGVNPITLLSDRFSVNKKFVNAGGNIDYRANKFSCVMIEV